MEPPSSDTMMKSALPPLLQPRAMAAGMSAQQIPQHHKRLRPRKISSTSTSRNLGVRVGKETLQPPHTRPGVRDSQHRGTGPHFPSGSPWRKRGSLCAHELGGVSTWDLGWQSLCIAISGAQCEAMLPFQCVFRSSAHTPSHAPQDGELSGGAGPCWAAPRRDSPSAQRTGPSLL